ncbi:MAG: nucleotidyltransferase family protein [Gammaproteobacteria bacterium]|nr:nucleotidyltransferase family protein [Gammaproteobacteria bacterium]
MKAMILAAGRGERMRGLTETLPKPLLSVHGEPLIVHHIKKLATAGIKDCVINLHYLADTIPERLGDGRQFGLRLHYSYEKEKLETGGGIIQTLEFFDNHPFLLISCDVFTDYPFQTLLSMTKNTSESLAHLVMVDNPVHHQTGDFAIGKNGLLSFDGDKLNYAGIGWYHPALFSGYAHGYRQLGDILSSAIKLSRITGEHYAGQWINVDTPERLKLANDYRLVSI